MPTFLMRKGIRVNFNKETKVLESFCYDTEFQN